MPVEKRGWGGIKVRDIQAISPSGEKKGAKIMLGGGRSATGRKNIRFGDKRQTLRKGISNNFHQA